MTDTNGCDPCRDLEWGYISDGDIKSVNFAHASAREMRALARQAESAIDAIEQLQALCDDEVDVITDGSGRVISSTAVAGRTSHASVTEMGERLAASRLLDEAEEIKRNREAGLFWTPSGWRKPPAWDPLATSIALWDELPDLPEPEQTSSVGLGRRAGDRPEAKRERPVGFRFLALQLALLAPVVADWVVSGSPSQLSLVMFVVLSVVMWVPVLVWHRVNAPRPKLVSCVFCGNFRHAPEARMCGACREGLGRMGRSVRAAAPRCVRCEQALFSKASISVGSCASCRGLASGGELSRRGPAGVRGPDGARGPDGVRFPL